MNDVPVTGPALLSSPTDLYAFGLQLGRIEEKQDAIINRLDRRDLDVNRILDKQDRRIGKLETLQYKVLGIAGALGVAAGAVGGWIKTLLPHS